MFKRPSSGGIQVKKAHLKYLGIAPRTLQRYRALMSLFYGYLDFKSIKLPSRIDGLDDVVAEYVNHLWHEGEPHGTAATTLSALSRFLPKARKGLGLARQYVKNWERALSRRMALPLTMEAVTAMAIAAYCYHREDLVAVLLVGFVGLFRTMEVLSIRCKDVTFMDKDRKALLSLPTTKSATRTGTPEQIILYDAIVVKALAKGMKGKKPNQLIYELGQVKFSEELSWLAEKFGIRHPDLTPYALRRGGATWHFTKYGSLDSTALLGRWASSKTVRIYIQQATADLAHWTLDPEKMKLFRKASSLFARIVGA